MRLKSKLEILFQSYDFKKWKWICEFNFKDPGNFRFNVNPSKNDIFNIFDWN